MAIKPIRPYYDLKWAREQSRMGFTMSPSSVMWLLDMLEEAANIMDWPGPDGSAVSWLAKYRGESDGK